MANKVRSQPVAHPDNKGFLMHYLGVVAISLMLLAVGLAPGAFAQGIGGGVVNIAPSIDVVDIDDADDTVLPSAGGTRSVVASATISDANGYLTLPASTAARMALVFGGNDVIAEAAAPRTSGSGNNGVYERTFSVPYYFAPGTYTIRVEVDDLLLGDTDSTKTFTYSSLLAANPGASVALGSSLSPGDVGSIVSLAVANTGNAAVDLQVSGSGPLTYTDATIPLSAVAIGTASNLAGSSALSTSATTLGSFSLAVASSSGASSGNVYFRLTIPSDSEYLPAGEYTATLTVTAIANA